MNKCIGNHRFITKKPSILNSFVAELRDVAVQKDPLRFRRNLERIGEVIALEISKELSYGSAAVKTPLGTSHTILPEDQPVVATILRAGLPMHQGFLTISTGLRMHSYLPTANIPAARNSIFTLSTFPHPTFQGKR
jgi:uracil phosphoribosyltransferase